MLRFSPRKIDQPPSSFSAMRQATTAAVVWSGNVSCATPSAGSGEQRNPAKKFSMPFKRVSNLRMGEPF